jgi:hypothetical protein
MTASKRTLLSAGLIGGIVFVVCALVAAGASQARSPCPPFQAVRLTGTLIEVRQNNAVVPIEPAILDGVPRSVCLSPTDANRESSMVTVADCDFPEFFVNAALTP